MQMWARLSVFGAGIELAAAEEVCAEPDSLATLGLLTALVDKSIVIRGTGDQTVRFSHVGDLASVRKATAERICRRDPTAT